LNQLLRKISICLKSEKYPLGKIVFRYGDKGSKFYIILKGSVSILIIKDNKIRLTFYEYILHLIRLYAIGEVNLMIKTVKVNKYIYDINEKNIIDFVNKYNKQLEKGLEISKNKLLNFDETEIKEITEFLNNIYFQIDMCSSSEEYINLIFPYNIREKEHSNYNQNQILIYSYFEINKCTQGNFFGEIALENSNSKRTATVICSEDCLFGTLSKEAYNICLRDIQINERRNNIKSLLSFSIFYDLNWNKFQNYFFNYFKIIHVNKNDIIINQGDPIINFFFVRKGEFEITSQLSNKQIDEIIYHLKYGNNSKDKKIKIKDYENDKSRFLRIFIFKDKDIIGLYDMIDLNEKNSFVNVKCFSNKGILFSIEKKRFQEIAFKFINVKNNFIEFTNIRRKIMINRLNDLKNSSEIKDINIQKDSLFDKINNTFIYKGKKREFSESEKKRLFSASPKCKNSKISNLKKITVKKSQNSFYKIQKDKIIKLLNTKKNYSIFHNAFLKQYTKSIPVNKDLSPIKTSLSYRINTINTDYSYKKSRNLFSRNITSFLSGNSVKNTFDSNKKNNNNNHFKKNEKMLKKIVGYSYRQRSENLNFKVNSKNDLFVNQMKIDYNNHINKPFIDILQFDSLNTYESNNDNLSDIISNNYF
jgi:CRP-like cAMP-binding protein